MELVQNVGCRTTSCVFPRPEGFLFYRKRSYMVLCLGSRRVCWPLASCFFKKLIKQRKKILDSGALASGQEGWSLVFSCSYSSEPHPISDLLRSLSLLFSCHLLLWTKASQCVCNFLLFQTLRPAHTRLPTFTKNQTGFFPASLRKAAPCS